jgi:predicted RNA binding protein YcfA (HicA-like mRNA interferase family)
MKRKDLIRHLEANGCFLAREGGSHSIWENPATGRRAAVPRHREISNITALKICFQLGVPSPLP